VSFVEVKYRNVRKATQGKMWREETATEHWRGYWKNVETRLAIIKKYSDIQVRKGSIGEWSRIEDDKLK